MKYQLVHVTFVIAIGHGLDGGHGFGGGSWLLWVDSLLGIRLGESSMQMLGQLLMLLGLLFSGLARCDWQRLGLG